MIFLAVCSVPSHALALSAERLLVYSFGTHPSRGKMELGCKPAQLIAMRFSSIACQNTGVCMWGGGKPYADALAIKLALSKIYPSHQFHSSWNSLNDLSTPMKKNERQFPVIKTARLELEVDYDSHQPRSAWDTCIMWPGRTEKVKTFPSLFQAK